MKRLSLTLNVAYFSLNFSLYFQNTLLCNTHLLRSHHPALQTRVSFLVCDRFSTIENRSHSILSSPPLSSLSFYIRPDSGHLTISIWLALAHNSNPYPSNNKLFRHKFNNPKMFWLGLQLCMGPGFFVGQRGAQTISACIGHRCMPFSMDVSLVFRYHFFFVENQGDTLESRNKKEEN